MNAKVLGALAAVALLAACAEKKPEMAAASGAGAATMPTIVPGSQEDLVKNVGDRVFFDFDKSILSGEDKATLDRQSAWLGKYAQVNVQIAGNCDERGTEEYNIALGQRRANAARDYLVAKGTQTARITTISFGKDRPTCTESTEACWAQNRNAITSVK
ncbi:MAG: peptidoglycan-associated lipoprotein Pal [Alphaproteobacteria bacterium]|nr:peptidoglycan-associated lipoprotein Pal [Alphaproteobacteria bacterium]